MANETAEQAMRAALASGMDPIDACHEVRRLTGITLPQAADLFSIVTTGRPIPEWAKSGTPAARLDPTGERRAWQRGLEPRSS